MRMIKRLLCAILATVIIIGLSMPLETKAATTTHVYYDSFEDMWDSYNSHYVWLRVWTRGSGTTTKYQYKVYVNGRIVKNGYSDVYKEGGSAKRFCKAYIPSNTFVTIRVRAKKGGVWSNWSGHTAIGPSLKQFNIGDFKRNTVKYTWKKMRGVTDYAAYIKNDQIGKWKMIKSVGPSATSISINLSNLARGNSYTIEIRPRKKINGKYVCGNGYDYSWIYRREDGSFGFTH